MGKGTKRSERITVCMEPGIRVLLEDIATKNFTRLGTGIYKVLMAGLKQLGYDEAEIQKAREMDK